MASPVTDAADPKRDVFSSRAPLAANVRALERELMELWASAADPAPAGVAGAGTDDTATGVAAAGGDDAPAVTPPVTRASLLSLVVVVESAALVQAARDLVVRVTEHAPGRVFIVELAEAAEGDAPLTAWVSAHCHRLSGGRQVCCEEITIRSAPAGDDLLSGVLLPLLVPDLPVFLYWPRAAKFLETLPGRPIPRGADLLCDLDPAIDYWVLDSALADDPVALQARLASLARRRPGGGMTPRDLNWARLVAWREALAQAVDDGRFDPGAVVRIDIEARGGCAGLCPARPALLAGWLLDRLDWDAPVVTRRDAGRIDIAAADGRRLTIRLAESSSGAGPSRPGQLDRVTIHEEARRFAIERAAVPRSDDSETVLLAAEIDRRGVDPAYRRALELAVTLLSEAS
jgi:glucose-6-phosphate dehydrogenase assembly protein OpcA